MGADKHAPYQCYSIGAVTVSHAYITGTSYVRSMDSKFQMKVATDYQLENTKKAENQSPSNV